MTGSQPHNAVIYCRVSSAAQLKKGDGLGSQETRCREFAKHKDYSVIKVFKDEGASGGMIDRPGMKSMLTFLKQHLHEQYVVLIDDISRLARGLEAHLQLRTEIGAAGGKLESPSIEFGEDSDSILVENLLASVSQHQRQKNAEQTLNRMKARAMNGYWVFNPPLGYRYAQLNGHTGKVLVRDEPVASVIVEAMEGFASGRFDTQVEVQRFLLASPHYPKDRSGEVHFQRVTNLLRKVIYTGHIEIPNWGMSLRQGKHEALISFETWQAIQKRLQSPPKVSTRKDSNDDFPLRGFVTCGRCQHPMTACWSKGRTATYPYYMCFKKGCEDYRKSIRRETLETEFEELLLDLRPSENLMEMAEAMFRELWESQTKSHQQNASALKQEHKKIAQKVEQLLDRIIDTENVTVIAAYEKRIKSLEENKIVLDQKIAQCGTILPDYDTTFRTALDFLNNPYKLWASERLEDKRTTLKLVFAQPVAYYRNQGFRTAEIALPFKVLRHLKEGNEEMAHPEGFEPPTKWFEATYSIQLSYGCVARAAIIPLRYSIV